MKKHKRSTHILIFGHKLALGQQYRKSLPVDELTRLYHCPGKPYKVRPVPLPLTRLLGRERDLEVLQQWLADPAARLITLVGPGGVGKTRLALEVAR